MKILILPTAIVILCTGLLAEDLRLAADTRVVLAGIEQARTVLTNCDDFIAALSRFDRSARMKTDQELTEADFVAFLGRSGLPWSATESNRLTRIFQNLREKQSRWLRDWQPLLVQRQPQLLDPREAQGFFEQVGRNTGYRFADARRPTHAHRIQGPENPD